MSRPSTEPTARIKPTIFDALILAMVSSVGPFSVNAYLPGFALIAQDFGVSPVLVQHTLASYLVGFALCSLFIGTVSDALGRRRVLLAGMAGFALASVLAMLSNHFLVLCAMRFLQGLTAGVGQVVTQAVVRDRFSGLDATRLNAMIAIIFSASPALAPVIGGYIVVAAGWRAVFVLLAAFSLAAFAVIFLFLEESLPEENRRPLSFLPLLGGYRNALANRAFVTGTLSNSFSFSGMLLYTAASADFILRILKMQPDDFGYLSFPMVLSSILGAWLCARIVSRVGGKRAIAGAFVFMVATSAASALANADHPLSYPLILAGPLLYSLGSHFCYPEMITMNLDYFPKDRGLAASINQCLQSLGFALASALVVPLVMGDMWKYSTASALLGAVALAFWMISLSLRKAALARSGVAEEHF